MSRSCSWCYSGAIYFDYHRPGVAISTLSIAGINLCALFVILFGCSLGNCRWPRMTSLIRCVWNPPDPPNPVQLNNQTVQPYRNGDSVRRRITTLDCRLACKLLLGHKRKVFRISVSRVSFALLVCGLLALIYNCRQFLCCK